MTESDKNKKLCLKLLKADKENEVKEILEEYGYWNDPSAWRVLGDVENNFGTAGNQQSTAEAALIEKITNSIDARLTNACLEADIKLESPDAPKNIKEAVGKFFEGRRHPSEKSGNLAFWDGGKLREEGDKITVAWTGEAYQAGIKLGTRLPSISVADSGEGQSPDEFPDTLCSLNKTNKVKINFVHGRFNMGGTGALRFCGNNKLEMIISRRNPKFINGNGGRDGEWGFTIIRRFHPKEGERASVYKYLAPVPINSKSEMQVLSFKSADFPIFPKDNKAYSRESEYGTLIKLYEYAVKQPGIVMGGGNAFIKSIRAYLPSPALPYRVYECRPYTGITNFAQNIIGLANQLTKEKELFEEGFQPHNGSMYIDYSEVYSFSGGYSLPVQIYAFKDKTEAKKYRVTSNSDGIIFTFNGQTHSSNPTRFFARKKVGLDILKDYLLVIVDCNSITSRDFEDLFMASRDRMSDSKLKDAIDKSLVEYLAGNRGLKELARNLREKRISGATSDASLAKLLQDVLHQDIHAWLITGADGVPKPEKTMNKPDNIELNLREYPTYFKFKNSKSAPRRRT